jgi:hypothetical protein
LRFLLLFRGGERRKVFAKHSIVVILRPKQALKQQEVQQPFDPVIDLISRRNFRHRRGH